MSTEETLEETEARVEEEIERLEVTRIWKARDPDWHGEEWKVVFALTPEEAAVALVEHMMDGQFTDWPKHDGDIHNVEVLEKEGEEPQPYQVTASINWHLEGKKRDLEEERREEERAQVVRQQFIDDLNKRRSTK